MNFNLHFEAEYFGNTFVFLIRFIKKYKWLAAAFLLWLILHAPQMNKDLVGRHVWRQTQTQGTIENFVSEDFNILNPREHRHNVYDGYYRMEFPLYQWLIAGLGKIFGSSIWLSRWVTQLIGLLSILGMFFFLKTFLSVKIAQIGAWCFAWSPSLFYFGINPLPDNLALCFGLWGLAYSFSFYKTKSGKHMFWSALFLALSTAVKLPFIILYAVPLFLVFHETLKRQWEVVSYYFIHVIFFTLPLVWYNWVIPSWDKAGIISGGEINRANFEKTWNHFVRNLWGVFPEVILNFGSLIFFFIGIWMVLRKRLHQSILGQSMLFLFVVLSAYFFYTLNMIGGHHEYYLFIFYPLVFLLVALGVQWMLQKHLLSKRLALGLLILLPVFNHLRSNNSWDTENPSVPKELLNKKEWFRSLTPKDELCLVGSDVSQYIYFYYLDKRGYAFGNDSIPPENLKKFVKQGVKYLYSDSRKLENAAYMKPYLDSLLYEEGRFKVFKIKSPEGFIFEE